MKNARALALLFLISVFLSSLAYASPPLTSVNANIPAQNSPLSSSVLRSQFTAVANDINTIFTEIYVGANQILGNTVAGVAVPLTVPPCATALTWTNGTGFGCASSGSGITAITGDVIASGTGSVAAALANTATARGNLGLGSSATVNTGTSGATLGLLSGSLTFSGNDIFTQPLKINLNALALPAAQTGTVVQSGNLDATVAREEVDSFGAGGHFTTVRRDGTNASPTTLQSGDLMGSFNSWGYNGTSVVGPQGSLQILANQNWSVGANGTKVTISTTPNGSATLAAIAQFENDGGVTVPPSVTGGDQGAGTINAAGLFVNGVAVSTGGSGSGTVNSGTANQIAFYGTSGTAVSGASALQYSTTTQGLNLNGLNGISLPDNGADTTSIAVGPGALAAYNTTTGQNVAVGFQAMAAALGTSSTGGQSVGIGYQALAAQTTNGGGENVAIGWGAGAKITTGNNNVVIGYNAGGGEAGAAPITTLTKNVCIGTSACSNAGGATLATAVGFGAGGNVQTTAIGYQALHSSFGATGNNTALGYIAGQNVSSGANNLILGPNVASTTLTTGSSDILIGTSNAVDAPAAGTSNWLNIGKAIEATLVAPTINSGFGTSPTIPAGTSSAVFTLNVGTGGSATSGVVLFATAAPTGYACDVTNTTSSATLTVASVPTSTTTSTFTSYSRTTGTTTAWNASDVLVAKCLAY